MINEEHSHQIQQEQERDFKRAEADLECRLLSMENRAFMNCDKFLRDDVKYVRNLIKMLGVNL